jgi:hypothetical protein
MGKIVTTSAASSKTNKDKINPINISMNSIVILPLSLLAFDMVIFCFPIFQKFILLQKISLYLIYTDSVSFL